MELVQNPRTLILGKKETDDDVKVFLDIVQLEPVSFVLLSDKFWRRRTKFFAAGPLLLPVGEADGGSLGGLARLAVGGRLAGAKLDLFNLKRRKLSK